MSDYKCIYDEQTKCWTSAKRQEVFNENLSIGELAFFVMNNTKAEDIMQISDSENTILTYGSALTTAIRLAQQFDSLHLGTEDVIAIFAPNSTFVMPVALAALFNCTPFLPINVVIEADAVRYIFAKSKPKVIFCDGLHYEKVQNACDDFKPLIYTICNHLENVSKLEDLLEVTKTEQHYKPKSLTKGPSQTMLIMLSSGTTGLSKGICISNRYCLTDLTFPFKYETHFSTSSIDWVTGLFTFFSNILRGGVRIITHKPFSAEYLVELISKYKITMLMSNPSNLIQLLSLQENIREKLKSLRVVLIGGSRCSENHLRQIRSLITNGRLYYGYGSTEMGGITVNPHDYKLKSVGKLLPNYQMKIVDQNSGLRLGPNQMGEICLRKTNDEWLGYFRNKEATDKTLDSEGFIHSGDLGYVDDEYYLYIVDRCQDVLKHLGFKWSPSEIELVISEMPDVLDVCVFDIFDEINLHVPTAAVVKRPGSSLTSKDVVNYVQERIEVHFKHLNGGAFMVEHLPRSRNGKLLRNKVREICLANK